MRADEGTASTSVKGFRLPQIGHHLGGRRKTLNNNGVLALRQFIAPLFFSLSALMPALAHATPITCKLWTNAAGELGGVSFLDALVTIAVYSDTSAVTSGAEYINSLISTTDSS